MILALKIFLINWFLLENNYTYKMLNDINFKFKENKYISFLFNEIILCLKCLTFWSILLITLNIWYALGFSFIACLYLRIKNIKKI